MEKHPIHIKPESWLVSASRGAEPGDPLNVPLMPASNFIISDLLAGVATTQDEAMWHALKKSRELTGATPGTLEAFLAVRGARTLALRLQRAQTTAMVLAERLERHPQVARVRYPGLPSHPTHAIARACSRGLGRSFRLTLQAAIGAAHHTERIRC